MLPKPDINVFIDVILFTRIDRTKMHSNWFVMKWIGWEKAVGNLCWRCNYTALEGCIENRWKTCYSLDNLKEIIQHCWNDRGQEFINHAMEQSQTHFCREVNCNATVTVNTADLILCCCKNFVSQYWNSHCVLTSWANTFLCLITRKWMNMLYYSVCLFLWSCIIF